jgi:hypothetical protein
MSDVCYYFGCKVSFTCPICGRCSDERMVYQAHSPDPKRIARALSQQTFDCQLCGAALVSRKRLNIRVVPADADSLRHLGFAIPRAA